MILIIKAFINKKALFQRTYLVQYREVILLFKKKKNFINKIMEINVKCLVLEEIQKNYII